MLINTFIWHLFYNDKLIHIMLFYDLWEQAGSENNGQVIMTRQVKSNQLVKIRALLLENQLAFITATSQFQVLISVVNDPWLISNCRTRLRCGLSKSNNVAKVKCVKMITCDIILGNVHLHRGGVRWSQIHEGRWWKHGRTKQYPQHNCYIIIFCVFPKSNMEGES